MGAVAVGHGSEAAGDFGDFIEKAETKAIGRALAALGYGIESAEMQDDSALAGAIDGGPGAASRYGAHRSCPGGPRCRRTRRCADSDPRARATATAYATAPAPQRR